MIWLLLILLLTSLILVYFWFDKELANPSLLLVAAYTISVFCCCLNINNWGVDLSLKTFLIILCGTIEFVLIGALVRKKYKIGNEKKILENIQEKKDTELEIHTIKGLLMVVFDICVLILLVMNVLDIASRFGEYSSLSGALTIFKQNVSYNNNAKLNPYIRIFIKFVIATGYVGLMSVISYIVNYGIKKPFVFLKKNFFNIICCIACVLTYFFQSNRGSIISFMIAGFVIAVIMWMRKNEWNKKIKLKTILLLIIIAIIGLILFYFAANAVGRINSKKMVDYITYYIGGSIECFNQFIKEPVDNTSEVFGEQTFSRFIVNLIEHNIINIERPKSIAPFIYYNGEMVGNIYTAYQRWIYDFGTIGAAVLQGIMAYVYSKLYYEIKYSKSDKKVNILLFIYAFIAYCVLFHPIDGYFYLEFFCKAGFANVVALIMTYIFCFEIDFKQIKNIKWDKFIYKRGKDE